ncbi:MAG TPA: pitrilysin family protein [Bacteroidota bacterium]|nr:pitrilysin family protein [Bacteroidota bacterium]
MRQAILAFLCLPMFVFAQQAPIVVPYERFQLPNGLDVILHEDHTTPTVSVNCWYHVGSSREVPGKTGLAHLFEHLMFMGSPHAPEGMFDQWLEAAGGENNASTSEDRTNYYEDVPSNAVELPLFLESDRMAFLVDAMTPKKVDLQRAVVKNERRQSYENRPYGIAGLLLSESIFPPGHPYHSPVIGSQEDLTNASYDDIVAFFKKYYVPNNASLVIAGDIDTAVARAQVVKWFSSIPAGAPVPPLECPMPSLTSEKKIVAEDNVQLPRLYMAWITPPMFAAGDANLDILASVLTNGTNSRLYKRLVYDLQIAQDVIAYQDSRKLASRFMIIATARPGHSLTEIKDEIQHQIDSIKMVPPSARELGRAVNQYEASFYRRLELVGGGGGVADQLNAYLFFAGQPDYFNQDLARYLSLHASDIQAAARTYLPDGARVLLSIVPRGKRELAVH